MMKFRKYNHFPKKYVVQSIHFFILLFTFFACKEDIELPNNLTIEANVRAKFIDFKSLHSLKTQKLNIENNIKELESKLEIIQESNNSNDNSDEINSINTQKKELEKELTLLNSQINEVNLGETEISIFNTISKISSSKPYHELPLNSNQSSSTFDIIINKKEYQFTLHYLIKPIYFDNYVIMQASNIKVFSMVNIDEIEISCTNCSNNETILSVFF